MALASWTDQQILNQLVSGYKWAGTALTYSFPATASGIYGSSEASGFKPLDAQQQHHAELALATWDELIAPDFQRVSSGSSNIEFGATNTGIGYAHAYFPTVGSVWFSSDYADLMAPSVGGYAFMAYVHEIGHAMGLDHMGEYNGSGTWAPSSYQDSTVFSVMSYFGPDHYDGNGLVAWADWVGADGKMHSPQTPMLNDIMAIQAIYGADTGTRTDDTVYGFGTTVTGLMAEIFDFSVNQSPILTIYDAGGVDTLNLSGWSTSSIINLAPGSYSSCASMTYNIAIAYGCDIENAVGGAGADTITGTGIANLLDGGAGHDSIAGGDGGDTLIGGAGNDAIDGGAGTDTAAFAATFASFTYAYDTIAQAFTFVSELTGSDTITGVEFFSFAGGVTKSASELTGAAPALPVLTITADQASLAEGNSGTTAFSFTIKLSAASATDESVAWSIAGAAGASDFTDATSGTLDFAPGETIKTITITVAGDTTAEADESFSVTLANPTAGMTLGTATASATIRNDDAAPSVITGTSGANTLNGTAANDSIYGLEGNDTLNGNGGNDLLDGGAGADKMAGGSGNDTYVVDNSSDSVSEGSSAGTDTILTTLASLTLASNIENLTYTGAAAFKGTGNGLANTLTGGSGNDTLNGGSGNDNLIGGDGDDRLTGGSGNDTFIGGGGSDTLSFADTGKNITFSLAVTTLQNTGGAGSDSLAAGHGIENLLGGGGADKLTGDSGANRIDGGGSGDTLNGGLGNDVLNGGSGKDSFVFDTALGADNVDTIEAYNVSDDTIRLENSGIFTAFMNTGTLSSGAFNTGSAATQADDRIIYNAATGALLYDADGLGGAAAIQFATLTGVTGTLGANDFMII